MPGKIYTAIAILTASLFTTSAAFAQCANGVCQVPSRPAITPVRTVVKAVATPVVNTIKVVQPVRTVARVGVNTIEAIRPVRRVVRTIQIVKPVRKIVNAVRPVRRVARVVNAIRPVRRVVGFFRCCRSCR